MVGAGQRTFAVVALLGCAVTSLVMGNWIAVDAEAGDQVAVRGVVALTLLVTAVLLSLGHPMARRTLGGLLVGLVLVLVVARFTWEGFRFVWEAGEPGSFALKVVLAVTGMTLLAPAYLAPGVASSADLEPEPHPFTRRQISRGARTALWVVTGGVVALVGHNLQGVPGIVGAVLLVATAWAAVRVIRSRSGASP